MLLRRFFCFMAGCTMLTLAIHLLDIGINSVVVVAITLGVGVVIGVVANGS